MATSQTDLPGGRQQDATIEFPIAQSLEELDEKIEQTYGMDVLKTLRNGDLDQGQMVEELHKYGLNGRSEGIEKMYRLHQQEFARKESLLGTTWRWTKNVVGAAANVATAPFRWTWQSFKSHPVMTTASLALLALGGYALASSQVAGIFGAVADMEGLSVANVVEKAQALIQSDLPLATGNAGAGTIGTTMPVPPDPF